MEGSTLGPVGLKLSLSPSLPANLRGPLAFLDVQAVEGGLTVLRLQINLLSRGGVCDLCPGIPATHTQATWVTGLMKSERHAQT